jgi:thioesterase domain-containing protein
MVLEPATTALESYLHEHIPLSKAMQVEVVTAEATNVVLRAPLEPNINHRETAFGGSVSALAILSAWSLLHTRVRAEGVECQLVIQRNRMDYDLPIAGPFCATASLSDPEDWPRFTRMLSRKGRSRITVASDFRLGRKPWSDCLSGAEVPKCREGGSGAAHSSTLALRRSRKRTVRTSELSCDFML